MKVLLPIIDPASKMKDYDSMAKCVKWLGELASSTTWVDEMKQFEK